MKTKMKAYCYKTTKTFKGSFKEGEWYTIEIEGDLYYRILDSENWLVTFWKKSKKTWSPSFRVVGISEPNRILFNNYFLNLEEFRDHKLEQILEN
jgi:hypothetical protein